MRMFASVILLMSISWTAQADDCSFINEKLLSLGSKGGIIQIPEGTFNCSKTIVVKKSHVVIRGAGRTKTVLRLADQIHTPVLVIGDDKVVQNTSGDWVTLTRVKDVEISDLTVDGNLTNHDPKKECGETHCDGDVQNIRNNAITIRGAEDIRILRVTAHSAISGGLVTEKYCRNLTVKDFISHSNYFDGFAGYQTEDSLFENMNLSRNRGAGISIDIDFNRNHFLGGVLASNGDVGIFMRDTDNLLFENLKIVRSGSHGVFLADDGVDPSSCADNNEFRSVLIGDSKGQGFHLASPCVGNRLTGDSVIQGNSKGCYYVNGATTLGSDSTVICRD